jgi:triosephosphate isomerase
MRRILMAGNWKMNCTRPEAARLAESVVHGVGNMPLDTPKAGPVDVVMCPPFTALETVSAIVSGTAVALGAQDVFWESSGAYTGEVSPDMLLDVGCSYVIVGHSERRQYMGETDEMVNRKARAALDAGLSVMMCVGETLEEREAGKMEEIVKREIVNGLAGINAERLKSFAVAYEPIWAIGTGKTATPQQANEAHQFIRHTVADLYGEEVAEMLTIQYGGSVKPDNIADLIAQSDIDGALVGGASLKADSFLKIVEAAL